MMNSIYRYFKSRHTSFVSFATSLAEECRKKGHYRREANYLTATRSFTIAEGCLPLCRINQAVLADYQQWMRERGISANTASCYNRTLRAIYNKAVSRGLTKDNHPFKECYTGRARTQKRAINEDCIRQLRQADLSACADLRLTRDLFLFSFYAMGMPFVDIAYLRKSQVVEGTLSYHRHKTRQLVTVPLCQDALHIINIYSATSSSAYVFPLIHSTQEPMAYQEYLARLNWYNRALKRLGKAVGIAQTLSSYTMRHSWASIAYRTGVPLPVISQALGHARPDTTMVYIRSIDNALLREGNDTVQGIVSMAK